MSYYVIKNKYSIPGFLLVAVASWVISFMFLKVALLVVWGINPHSDWDAKSLPWPLVVPLFPIFFNAVVGSFSLYMLMWVYWIAVERSSLVARIAWRLVLLLVLNHGATIYALVIWKRAVKKVARPQPLRTVTSGG